jgi:hypothetical protein
VPIIYIHGVNVRDASHGEGLRSAFLRWVAPALGPEARERLAYYPVFWGDCASDFHWNLECRPKTKILRAGAAETAPGLARTAPETLMRAPQGVGGGAVSGPVVGAPTVAQQPTLRLAGIAPEHRADMIADLYVAARSGAERDGSLRPLGSDQAARISIVASDVATELWDTVLGSDAMKLSALLNEMNVRLTLVATAGVADWFARSGELLGRALDLPGNVLSTFLAETRPILNSFVANFIGDVLAYTRERDVAGATGRIQTRVLDAFRRVVRQPDGLPLVVVTHSMGGQLLFDAVSHFMNRDPELMNITVDHWITCGSQVSFFAELGQFPGVDSSIRAPRKLQRPERIKAWTNFYDPNDFVGFVMEPIFDGVRDVEYDTGYGLMFAHTGFFHRPSFYSQIALTLGG